MKKKSVLFFFVLLHSFFFLSANPFTGNKNSPAPVRQARPSEPIVKHQRIINEKLGDYIAGWKENGGAGVFFTVLGMSFLYGVVHAAGPGHRKTVIFSFYIAKKASAVEPLLVSLGIAGIHGGTAILIMLIFKGISGAVSVNSNNTAIYMEGFSFLILIALSVYGIIDAVADVLKKKSGEHKKLKLGAVLLSGMYPCPAAMLVLVLSVSLNVLTLGFFAVIVLSLGMSVPIIICAYLAWAGRTGLFYKLKDTGRHLALAGCVLQIAGYLFLLAVSVRTALPFIAGLFVRKG